MKEVSGEKRILEMRRKGKRVGVLMHRDKTALLMAEASCES